MSLTIWDVSISRDRGGERWDRPRIEWPKVYRYPHSRREGMRIGWRMTAWGLHVGRRYVSDEEYPDVLVDAKASTERCERRFEFGDRTVRVRYSCGKVVEFGNLPPWPANDAVFAARLPDAPHPHENAEMRWPR